MIELMRTPAFGHVAHHKATVGRAWGRLAAVVCLALVPFSAEVASGQGLGFAVRQGGAIDFGGGVVGTWRSTLVYARLPSGVRIIRRDEPPVPIDGADEWDPRIDVWSLDAPEPDPKYRTHMMNGVEALAKGDYEAAQGFFVARLADAPGDYEALRLLGIARFAGGERDAGVQTLSMAYALRPELGLAPVSLSALGGDREARALTVRAVRHAHDRASGPAWLLAAVLLQSRGGVDAAGRTLDRAVEAGLEGYIADWIRGDESAVGVQGVGGG